MRGGSNTTIADPGLQSSFPDVLERFGQLAGMQELLSLVLASGLKQQGHFGGVFQCGVQPVAKDRNSPASKSLYKNVKLP
jgi:hypothetical protein